MKFNMQQLTFPGDVSTFTRMIPYIIYIQPDYLRRTPPEVVHRRNGPDGKGAIYCACGNDYVALAKGDKIIRILYQSYSKRTNAEVVNPETGNAEPGVKIMKWNRMLYFRAGCFDEKYSWIVDEYAKVLKDNFAALRYWHDTNPLKTNYKNNNPAGRPKRLELTSEQKVQRKQWQRLMSYYEQKLITLTGRDHSGAIPNETAYRLVADKVGANKLTELQLAEAAVWVAKIRELMNKLAMQEGKSIPFIADVLAKPEQVHWATVEDMNLYMKLSAPTRANIDAAFPSRVLPHESIVQLVKQELGE